MAVKRNQKRGSSDKRRASTPLVKLKTFAVTSAVLSLAAIGLWRCFEDDFAAPPVKKKATPRVTAVDVGKGETADPTLINEKQLLEEEIPDTQPPEPEKDAPAAEEEAEPKKSFSNFGVAFQFHTQMLNEPKIGARVVAYARRGATFRLSERISTDGCKKGWYEVEPGSLFICSGQGVLVDDEPVGFAPSPPPPSLDKPLPYRYAYVTRDNTPEYWRAPTTEETKAVGELFARLSEKDAAAAAGEVLENADLNAESPIPSAIKEAIARVEAAASTAAAGGAPLIAPAEIPLDAGTGAAEAREQTLELPAYVHLRMAKGYYVSADDEIEENGARYRRTVRGRLVPADSLAEARLSDFEGILLKGKERLPRAFVVGGGVKMLRRDREDGPFKTHDAVGRLTDFDFLGTVTLKNKSYVRIGQGLYLPSRTVAVVSQVTPPEDVKENERWIDVDLSEQTLVAYEGEKPVFATLVSTGREGFATPTGSFRVYSKHVAITMDDTQAGAEAYSIEDVPWVQYFKDSYALHGAFWHDRFGRVRSHGCINLSPRDARRLFFWTGPHLPDGVHGASSTRENPGTRVVIHE